MHRRVEFPIDLLMKLLVRRKPRRIGLRDPVGPHDINWTFEGDGTAIYHHTSPTSEGNDDVVSRR